MVKENKKMKFHYCEQCNMAYTDRKKADECGEWCKKYKSCNLNITKHSLSLKGGKKK